MERRTRVDTYHTKLGRACDIETATKVKGSEHECDAQGCDAPSRKSTGRTPKKQEEASGTRLDMI